MRHIRLGALCALLLALVAPASAQSCTNNSSDPLGLANNTSVLFIDKSNCNCQDNGSRTDALNPLTPWCSPAAMNNKAFNPGDIIFVRQGDYAVPPAATNNHSIGIYSSGTAPQRITLQSYPGETAVIRGNALYFRPLFGFVSASHWTIQNLNFFGYVQTPAGRQYIPKILEMAHASGLEIKNAQFFDVQGTDDNGYGQRWPGNPQNEGWGAPLQFLNVDGLVIDNVQVRTLDDPAKIRLNFTNADGLLCDNCRNVTVTNSRFLDAGHVGLTFRNSSNVLIEKNVFNNRLHTSLGFSTITSNPGATNNNIVRNNTFYGLNQYPSYSNPTGNHIQVGPGGVSNLKIYNNVIYDGYNDATGITLIANRIQDPTSTPITGTQIFHNTLYRAGLRGILLGTMGTPVNQGVINTKIYNNIIAENKTNPAVQSNAQFELAGVITDFVANNGYGNEFKNNLVYTLNPNGFIADIGSGDGTQHVAYTPASFDATNFADDTRFQNPLFVNAGAANFRLQANSPAINTAICQPEVAADFDGITRSLGDGCSIGAFEFDAPASPSPACGNGLLETGETCDQGNTVAGDGCSSSCQTESGWVCTNQPSLCVQSTDCGNNQIEGSEACDSSNLNNQSCVSLGYSGGRLNCSPQCEFDFTQCTSSPSTPACSDGLDNDLDGAIDFGADTDCESPLDPSEGMVPPPPTPPAGCVESWRCSPWSDCALGRQTRSCEETNACKTIAQVPELIRSCASNDLIDPFGPDTNTIAAGTPVVSNPDGILQTAVLSILIVLLGGGLLILYRRYATPKEPGAPPQIPL